MQDLTPILALVVERDPGDRRKESVRIHQALRGLGYPFDVIVISTEWFEESKNVIGGIAYPANKYGKVIYEAAWGSETRARPSVARQGRTGSQGCRIAPLRGSKTFDWTPRLGVRLSALLCVIFSLQAIS